MSKTSATIDPTTIDNVQEWYRATHPTEFQIDEINSGLSFSWLQKNLCDRCSCSEKVRGLDTMVRENIYHEALVRKLLAIRKKIKSKLGMYKFAVKMMKQAGYTRYGVECAFKDASVRLLLDILQ